MITKTNIKEVVNNLSVNEKKRIASCRYEYVILTNLVFNVGSVSMCKCTNTYQEIDECNSCILPIDDEVFSNLMEV